MALVIVSETLQLQPWIAALKKAGPEVEILTQQEVKDPGKVEFALAWNHRPGICKEFPNLKTISSMGAGVDHLMKDPDIPQHIRIVRIIDPMLSQDMYEFVLALILSRMKNLRLFQEQQQQKVWKKKRYLRMGQLRVGIMGTGVIGHHVATALLKVGFNVLGWSRTEGQPSGYRKFFGQEQMKDFLNRTDILVCLLPLTPETKGILNRGHLTMLPAGAGVINVGRGGHVVDEELIEVIDSGHLDGASLDVFQEEPLSPQHPFWSHHKIQMTPHNASLTDPDSVAPQILENYYRTLRGEPLLNMVNREAGY